MLKFFYNIIFNVNTYKFIFTIIVALLIVFIFSKSFDNMVNRFVKMFPGLEGFEGCDYCGKIIKDGLKNDNSDDESIIKNECNKCLNRDNDSSLLKDSSNYLPACEKIATNDIRPNSETFLKKLCQFSIGNGLWTTSANPDRPADCPNGCNAPKSSGDCETEVYFKDISGTTKQIQYRFCPYKSDDYRQDCKKCGMKLMKMGEYDTATKIYKPETFYERAQKKNNAFKEEDYGDDRESRQLGDFTPDIGLLQGNRYFQGSFTSNTNDEPDRRTTTNMFANNNDDDHAGYGSPPGLGFNTHNDDPRYGNSPTIMDYKGWNPDKPPKFYNALMSLF